MAGSAASAATPLQQQQLHPLHRLGPRWATAPLLVHELLQSSSSSSKASSAASGKARKARSLSSADADKPPPPYRWMLVARDDTLWLPHAAVSLLSQYDSDVAAAVTDHAVDYNGVALLAPSPAAAVCLPCGLNLTALLGRRRPPRVPQPTCPVCRPAAGCEFRFDLCGGLAGGPVCGSKRFLGAGDRCAHSWVAGGAGLALSHTLLEYLDKDAWTKCVLQNQPSTGERSLSRCLWRDGFAFTNPAAGLAANVTRDAFSPDHMLFGNPVTRQDIFGAEADTLLAKSYKAVADAAAAAVTAAAAAAAGEAEAEGGPRTVAAPATAATSTAALVSALASTRERAPGTSQCDAGCKAWLTERAVSAHLDVPYGSDPDEVAAAAKLMGRSAQRVAERRG